MLIRKNSKGVSLIEALAAAAIVGISVAVSFQSYINSMKSVSRSQKKEVYPFLQTDIQSRLQGFVFDTQSTGSTNNAKLCQLLQPETVDFGVAPVKVVLNKANLENILGPTGWDASFGTLGTMVPQTECGIAEESTSVSKCVRVKMDSMQDLFEGTPGRANEQLYASLKVSFFKINPKSGNSFLPVDISAGASFDAKEVILQLETDIRNKEKAVLSNREQMYWFAEIGTCNISGKEVAVSATGLGDKDGKRVYNATTFGKKPPEPFDVRFERKVIQEGKFLGNGSLVSDLDKNIAVSCIETKYRCPNSSQKRNFLSPMNIELKVDYSNDNEKFNLSEATVNPSFNFSGVSGQEFKVDSRNVELIVNGDTYISNGNNKFFQVKWEEYTKKETVGYDYEGKPIRADVTHYRKKTDYKTPLRMTKGTHSVAVDIEGTENMCTQVCNNPNDKYFPKLDFMVEEQKGFKQTFQSSTKLGCTVCLMKNCSRLGLGTFGPIDQYTDEPLDGRVPECVLNNKSEVVEKNPIKNIGNLSGSGKCVAAKFNGSRDALVLTTEDCSTQLPVLCYNYGTFSLARTVDFQTNAFIKATQDKGSRTCYEMGREIMSKEKVTSMFDQYRWIDKGGLNKLFSIAVPYAKPTGTKWLQQTLDSKHFVYSDTLIQFQNNATQGLFLAPQTGDQIRSMAKYMTKYQPTALNEKFWVALNKGSMGEVVAAPPRLSTQNVPAEELSFYFSSDGKPYIVEDKYHPSQVFDQDTNPERQGVVLGYGVRHKGVYVAKKWQNWNSTNWIKFLCKRRNSDEFFVTQREEDDMAYGHSFCLQENGFFVPPSTPLQWAQAMQEVSKNSSELPFPDPRQWQNRTENQFVWVAMEGANYDFSWARPQNWKNGLKNLDTSKTVKFNKNLSVVKGKGEGEGEDEDKEKNKEYKACIFSTGQNLSLVEASKSCPNGSSRAKANMLSNDYYLAKLYQNMIHRGNKDVVVFEP